MPRPMDFLKKLTMTHILKLAGLALIVIVVGAFALQLTGTSVQTLLNKQRSVSGSPAYYDQAESYGKAGFGYGADAGVALSERNVITSPEPPRTGGTTGDTAEQFEVTEYRSTIETRNLQPTCTTITDLKKQAYVIFEQANQYDHGCDYTFKVAQDHVAEILSVIENLNPKELAENTYTIQQQIEDFTSQTEILERQLDSINETLENAIAAYDDITALATRTQDVESLTKIIDSKIGIIERLTQQRINTTTQLEYLSRAKAEQLDRLNYTYFYVNISENKFIDGDDLKDSWKEAIKAFVQDINQTVQDITINLVALLFLMFQYILYLTIILVVAKYGWQLVKRFWEK